MVNRGLKHMRDDSVTLFELMLAAERACNAVEPARAGLVGVNPAEDELRLKIGQCRNLLTQLHRLYDQDRLRIDEAEVRGHFQHLVTALMWACFWSRERLDRKVFRMLVNVQFGFTYLLMARWSGPEST
jgi:hypothetical protein